MRDRLHALLDRTWILAAAALLAVLAGVAVGYWAVAAQRVEHVFTPLPSIPADTPTPSPSPSRGTP